MKVVHFTNNLRDGAGKAAYRLHKALLRQGVKSLMLVFQGDWDDNTVVNLNKVYAKRITAKSNKDILIRFVRRKAYFARKRFWKLKLNKWNPLSLFNLNMSFVSISELRKYLQGVDIVCLHSIQAFLSSSLIRDIYLVCKAPVVWTLMDIEPLTGGCHFNNGCDGFTKKCGNCPELKRKGKNDLSRRIWNQKNRDFQDIPISFVAPTSNSYEQIAQSSLFRSNRIGKIVLSVPESIYRRVDKKIAREALHLPVEKKIILFGCFSLDDPRKGGKYLLEALRELPPDLDGRKLSDSVILVTMGRKGGFDASDLPFEWVHMGGVSDDRILSLIYQASDVLACPSIDDIGPMIINDAIACGTPVVAYDSGVAPDLIKSEDAGYVAIHSDVNDFRSGLVKCLSKMEINENNEDLLELRKMCTHGYQAKQYSKLFEELVNS